MAKRHRVRSHAARVAFAGVFLAASTLSTSALAAAQPEVPLPTPVPGDPAAPPAPGQPVAVSFDEPVGPQPPPPVGAPPVPEINPVYGQGQTPGQFGYIRDLWRAFHSGNPLEAMTMPPGVAPGPPPGAGPPPPLPPGHISLTAPQSSTGLPAEAPGAPPGPVPPPPPTVVPVSPTP